MRFLCRAYQGWISSGRLPLIRWAGVAHAQDAQGGTRVGTRVPMASVSRSSVCNRRAAAVVLPAGSRFWQEAGIARKGNLHNTAPFCSICPAIAAFRRRQRARWPAGAGERDPATARERYLDALWKNLRGGGETYQPWRRDRLRPVPAEHAGRRYAFPEHQPAGVNRSAGNVRVIFGGSRESICA